MTFTSSLTNALATQSEEDDSTDAVEPSSRLGEALRRSLVAKAMAGQAGAYQNRSAS